MALPREERSNVIWGLIGAFVLGIIFTGICLGTLAYKSPHHIAVIYVNEDGKKYAEQVTK